MTDEVAEKIRAALHSATTPRLRSADSVEVTASTFLWKDKIPQNALTILAGFGGLGKSTLATLLAADVSKGSLPGDMYGTPSKVLILTAEDVWESTMTPRLIASGADRSKIHFYDIPLKIGSPIVTHPITVPENIELIQKTLADAKAEKDPFSLVILDPFVSFLSSDTQSHNDASVRKVLDPLTALAAERRVSILAIMHFNKSDTKDPMRKLSSSNAFWNAARSVLFFGKKYDDPDASVDRYLVQTKSNLGLIDANSSIHYEMETFRIAKTATNPEIVTSKLEFIEFMEMDKEDIYVGKNTGGRPSKESEEVAVRGLEMLRLHGVMKRSVFDADLMAATSSSVSTIKRWLREGKEGKGWRVGKHGYWIRHRGVSQAVAENWVNKGAKPTFRSESGWKPAPVEWGPGATGLTIVE